MKKEQILRVFLSIIDVIFLTVFLFAKTMDDMLETNAFMKMEVITFILFVVLTFFIILDFLFENKIEKGFEYFIFYWVIKKSIEQQLIDAGIYVQRLNNPVTPEIVLEFDDDLSRGMLRIRNNIKFDKKFDGIDFSAALRNFIVEKHYLSNDANWYVYELVNASKSFKQKFNSIEEFSNENKTHQTYKLFLDARTEVKMQHILLVGQTGSGKTYSLYSVILQMLFKNIKYNLYFADPKNSSLAVIGEAMNSNKTAIDIEEIIILLEEFVQKMHDRKSELKYLLQKKIDADYSDFGLEPYVFICDEYASFVSVLASYDKKTRDKVKALLYEVVLQGRQLGFYLIIAMQKSDANLIDTAIRDNITLKIVLGNSEQQTYVTAFGTGVVIPNKNYKVGEGVFTEPTITTEPRLVQFPYLGFDILGACGQTPVV